MGPFKPAGYRISLEPDLRAFTFRGRVTVEGEMESPGREVLLNAAELEVRQCLAQAGREAERCAVTAKRAEQLLVISLPREITGRLVLTTCTPAPRDATMPRMSGQYGASTITS